MTLRERFNAWLWPLSSKPAASEVLAAPARFQVNPNVRRDVSPGAIAVDAELPTIAAMGKSLSLGIGNITPVIPREFIDLLFTLSVSQPLLSQVVWDNIILGATGYSLDLQGPAGTKKKALEEANKWLDSMYPGGVTAWISAALYQIQIAGALSHEYVIADNLKGVVRSKFVPAQTIRFNRISDTTGEYVTVQSAHGKYLLLNPTTYHYRALLTWENNPYAIPPLFSAIEPIWLKRDVMKSMRGIAKKFGLLGLFQILLERPPQDLGAGESDENYHARLKTYLSEAQKALKGSFNDGVLIGYSGQHEFKHFSVTGDARGMGELYDRIDMEAHSGSNTDPAMHGRNFSRTETHIRQVYQKMTRQLENMRRMAGESLEYGIELHLTLAGFPGFDAELVWDKVDTVDALRDEQTYNLKIVNANALYDAGIINQEQRAQMLGFQKADSQTPRDSSAAAAMFTAGHSQKKKPDTYCPPWPVLNEHSHDGNCAHFEFGRGQFADDKIQRLIESYVTEAMRQSNLSADTAMRAYRLWARNLTGPMNEDVFVEAAYEIVAQGFQGEMESVETRAIIRQWAEDIYRESLLGEGFRLTWDAIGDKVQFDPIFEPAKDTFILDFLRETDSLYLGKFIRRGDVADRMKQTIIEEYIAVGRDYTDKAFIQSVADRLGIEARNAEMIVRTTASTSRNFASLRIMEQSRVVQRYEIVGPSDRLKCPWCQNMLGRTFSVESGVSRMNQMLDAGPENFPEVAPFLVGAVKAADLEEMSDYELQRAGFSAPPYHPRCRDRLVALL